MRANIALLAAAALCLAPAILHAQVDFRVAGNEVQVHGFFSQGFAYSNQNNFLTMDTSQGTAAMTDFGVNFATQLTEKMRVGAQVYGRNFGQLGGWRPLLDYAYVDYRFKDWLGIRAGRVKTQLGLYTSTQDADFLRPWALLPQSIYPSDLRSTTIAHDGVDVYGAVTLGRAGTLEYAAYAGLRPDDRHSGMYYQLEDAGWSPRFSGSMTGADVHWSGGIRGLTVGASQIFQKERATLQTPNIPLVYLPAASIGSGSAPTAVPTVLPDINAVSGPDRTTAGYADYTLGRLHFATEYRRTIRQMTLNGGPYRYVRNLNETSWFASASYRLNRRLEFGAYNSRFYVDHPIGLDLAFPALPNAEMTCHIFDQVATLRVDLARFWNVKMEGHFINGVGDPFSPHGFYLRVNGGMAPTYQPSTNMLILRTGWDF